MCRRLEGMRSGVGRLERIGGLERIERKYRKEERRGEEEEEEERNGWKDQTEQEGKNEKMKMD